MNKNFDDWLCRWFVHSVRRKWRRSFSVPSFSHISQIPIHCQIGLKGIQVTNYCYLITRPFQNSFVFCKSLRLQYKINQAWDYSVQSINQSINQSVNQSINQVIRLVSRSVSRQFVCEWVTVTANLSGWRQSISTGTAMFEAEWRRKAVEKKKGALQSLCGSPPTLPCPHCPSKLHARIDLLSQLRGYQRRGDRTVKRNGCSDNGQMKWYC